MKSITRPPYSRLLAERAVHTSNSWWVLIGAEAWATAKAWAEPHNHHRPFTACPPDADPSAFDWSIYRNAPPPVGLVRCGGVDGGQVQSLVRCLLEAGARRVYDVLSDAAYRPGKGAAA